MNSIWRQLYPDGDAFDVSENTNRTKLHESIDEVLNGFISQLKSLVDGTIAAEVIDLKEVEFLEYKYGIYFTEGLTLNERIERIRARMTYPNGVVNRSSAAWIQHVLRSFGFDVYVYENLNMNPSEIADYLKTQYGNSNYGSSNYGGYKFNVIANSMFENENYNFGGVLWATFFINIVTPIESGREREFRELVLKLKPAHLCAIIYNGEVLSGDFNEDFNNDYLVSYE